VLVLERLAGTRIVATPAALDRAIWPAGVLVLRLAPDEVLVTAPVDGAAVADPHAIIVSEGGFVGVWVAAEEARALLEHHCEWEPPASRPAFAQGMVAGLPMKLWFEERRVLFLTPAPYAHELVKRLF